MKIYLINQEVSRLCVYFNGGNSVLNQEDFIFCLFGGEIFRKSSAESGRLGSSGNALVFYLQLRSAL